MGYVFNQSFSGNNIELLINQLSAYEPRIKGSEIKSNAYSYLNGANFIMENLLELYNNAKESAMGGVKIYALNMTVNKSVLSNFLKELKADLCITDKIFNGGALDIPIAKQIIDSLEKKYNIIKINNEAYLLGAKKVAKVIKYAYYAPLTKPFQHYIINESKGIVQNISKKLNNL